jgi:hypothetical protein
MISRKNRGFAEIKDDKTDHQVIKHGGKSSI